MSNAGMKSQQIADGLSAGIDALIELADDTKNIHSIHGDDVRKALNLLRSIRSDVEEISAKD